MLILFILTCVSASGYCPYGSYLTGTNSCRDCKLLYENCLDCTSYQCLKCDSNNYLSGLACYPCSSDCEVCSNSFSCNACKKGYTWSSGRRACIECSRGCIECISTISSGSGCQKCETGYQLVYNDNLGLAECEKCELQTCSSCQNNTCTCKPKHATVIGKNGLGVRCVPCGKNCNSCQGDAQNLTCTSCEYPLNLMENKCCPDHCSNCSSDSICFATTSDEYYISDGKPITCYQLGCKTCKISPFETCLSCNLGFYLTNSSCINCSKSCSKCSENCLSCSNSSDSCTSCTSGKNLKNSRCCPVGCLRCDESNICTGCTEGYMLNTKYECVPCPLSCKKCIQSLCECSSGIYFLNFIYQPCDDFYFVVYGILIFMIGYFVCVKLRKYRDNPKQIEINFLDLSG